MAAVAPRPLLPHLEQRQQPARPQALRQNLLLMPAITAPRNAQQQQPPPPQPGAASCLPPPPGPPSGGAARGTALAFVRQRRRHRLVRAEATARARSAGHAGEEARAGGGDSLLTLRTQQELALAAGQGDQRAAALLVDSNRRLVHYFARRFLDQGLDREDLVAEGMLALQRASTSYKSLPDAPARFATFAAAAVCNGMARAIHNHSRDIRLPVHHYRDMSRVKAATQRLASTAGRQPRCKEVATACGFSVSYTQHLLRALADRPRAQQAGAAAGVRPEEQELGCLADRGGCTLEEAQGQAEEGPVEALAQVEASWLMREQLRRGLAMLPPRQAAVVAMRYGLDGGGAQRSFKAIGDALGHSGSWANYQFQLAERALQVLMGSGGSRQEAEVDAPLADAGLDAGAAAALKDGLGRLKLEEQLVVALRYGWVDGSPASHAAAGQLMNRPGSFIRSSLQRADVVLRACLQVAGHPRLRLQRVRFGERQRAAWQVQLAKARAQPRTQRRSRGASASHMRPGGRSGRGDEARAQPAARLAAHRGAAMAVGPRGAAATAGSSAHASVGARSGADAIASSAVAAVAAAWPQPGPAEQREPAWRQVQLAAR